YLQPRLMAGKTGEFLADASVFMELASYIVIGWQWLKMGVTASRQLSAEKSLSDSSRDRLQFILHTMEFYFRYELSHTAAFESTICRPEQLTRLSETDWKQATSA
ncbi:MAG: acyl-CoA dehydrogenase C-terminal domain-containing protein, partial [Chitinophagaceae bacterium]|nr:acyl-CoA dehydrogenase C-terminal domain-containing protein [Chitinophagaceae bacterium]